MFEPCHWMTKRMADPEAVVAIVSPRGEHWMLGDEVMVLPSGMDPANEEVFVSKLTHIFPGDGRWDPCFGQDDSHAVWFYFENGWGARPWLCRRLRG